LKIAHYKVLKHRKLHTTVQEVTYYNTGVAYYNAGSYILQYSTITQDLHTTEQEMTHHNTGSYILQCRKLHITIKEVTYNNTGIYILQYRELHTMMKEEIHQAQHNRNLTGVLGDLCEHLLNGWEHSVC